MLLAKEELDKIPLYEILLMTIIRVYFVSEIACFSLLPDLFINGLHILCHNLYTIINSSWPVHGCEIEYIRHVGALHNFKWA